MVLGSSPVAVTSPSDFAPASSKEFLDIQATIECGFTLKRVRDMTRTYSHLQYLFKQQGLQIIIGCNLKVVNYLDVTFNLNHGSYRPYRKPHHKTHYTHIQSDHPPSITKQLPRSMKKCLSKLSSSKDIFNETAPYYEQRLASCGYNDKLTY